MTVPPPSYPPPGSPPPPPPQIPPGGPPVGPWGGAPPPTPPPRQPGRLVGGLLAVAFVLLLFLVGTATTGAGFDLLIGGALTGIVAGTVAVAFERTRPYATGFLLGLAIIVVVGAGACVGLLAIFASTY